MHDFNLNNQKIESGFKVPEGYFDTLHQHALPKLEPAVIPLYKRRPTYIMAAAAALILALLIPAYNAFYSTPELDETTLESYLAYHSGMTQFDLLTEMQSEDIGALEIDFPAEDEAIEDALATNSNFEQLVIE